MNEQLHQADVTLPVELTFVDLAPTATKPPTTRAKDFWSLWNKPRNNVRDVAEDLETEVTDGSAEVVDLATSVCQAERRGAAALDEVRRRTQRERPSELDQALAAATNALHVAEQGAEAIKDCLRDFGRLEDVAQRVETARGRLESAGIRLINSGLFERALGAFREAFANASRCRDAAVTVGQQLEQIGDDLESEIDELEQAEESFVTFVENVEGDQDSVVGSLNDFLAQLENDAEAEADAVRKAEEDANAAREAAETARAKAAREAEANTAREAEETARANAVREAEEAEEAAASAATEAAAEEGRPIDARRVAEELRNLAGSGDFGEQAAGIAGLAAAALSETQAAALDRFQLRASRAVRRGQAPRQHRRRDF